MITDKAKTQDEQKAKLADRLRPPRGNLTLRLQNQAAQSSNDSLMLILAIASLFIPGGFLVALFPAFSGRGAAQCLGIISACLNLGVSIVMMNR